MSAERKNNQINLKNAAVRVGAAGVAVAGGVAIVETVQQAPEDVFTQAFAKLGVRVQKAEAQTPPANLLQNGNFNTSAGWYKIDSADPNNLDIYQAGVSHTPDGSGSIAEEAKCVSRAIVINGWTTDTVVTNPDAPHPINPTQTLTEIFYASYTAVNSTRIVQPSVQTYFYDSNSAYLGADQQNFNFTVPQGSWEQFSHTISAATIPQNAKYFRFQLNQVQGAFDCLTVSDGTVVTTLTYDDVVVSDPMPQSVGGIAELPTGLPPEGGTLPITQIAIAGATLVSAAVAAEVVRRRNSHKSK